MKRFFKGPGGIELQLDSWEVFADDPGQGTPAMVNLKLKSATYQCASAVGEVDDIQLTHDQKEWLLSKEATVNRFIEDRLRELRGTDPHAVIDQKIGPDIVCRTCGAHFNQHRPGCPDEP